ncbi:MAG: DUF559 domain-containing protein [Polyangiaceae bacterium]|nr:DUF559 domain-containing protein [Polyangiaceae bacterium]
MRGVGLPLIRASPEWGRRAIPTRELRPGDHERHTVEVDGGPHCARGAADARRDGKLVRLGFRVLRLEADLVERALPEALARVRQALGR